MKISYFIFLSILIGFSVASPKKYVSEEGYVKIPLSCKIVIEVFLRSFQPSANNRYYETNLPSPTNNISRYDLKETKESSDRLRFGIPVSTYGNTGTGIQYGGNTGTGYVFSPMKIDVGGIALGALIGLGAILIVPKLASAFTGGYGYRSIQTLFLLNQY